MLIQFGALGRRQVGRVSTRRGAEFWLLVCTPVSTQVLPRIKTALPLRGGEGGGGGGREGERETGLCQDLHHGPMPCLREVGEEKGRIKRVRCQRCGSEGYKGHSGNMVSGCISCILDSSDVHLYTFMQKSWPQRSTVRNLRPVDFFQRSRIHHYESHGCMNSRIGAHCCVWLTLGLRGGTRC